MSLAGMTQGEKMEDFWSLAGMTQGEKMEDFWSVARMTQGEKMEDFWSVARMHGWEHKISKSRHTQATGGKNCEKAGKLPRLCGDIIQ